MKLIIARTVLSLEIYILCNRHLEITHIFINCAWDTCPPFPTFGRTMEVYVQTNISLDIPIFEHCGSHLDASITPGKSTVGVVSLIRWDVHSEILAFIVCRTSQCCRPCVVVGYLYICCYHFVVWYHPGYAWPVRRQRYRLT